MSELVSFEYGDSGVVRTIIINGEPWFVLADLCKVLGISRFRTERIDGEWIRNHTLATAGGHQEMAVVSEQGMYEIVIRSDKPEALAFRRWITGTVLPQIRKTGTYNAAPALTGPELVATALIESQKMLEAREARIHQLEHKITTDAPKVGYIDQFVTDTDLLSFSTVASTSGITEKALRALLIEKDWIFVQTDSRWSESKQCKVTRNRYSEKAAKKRHFRRVENHEAPRFRGNEVMHTLKVTPYGAESIARLVQKEQAA